MNTSSNLCRNCGTTITGKFCHNCGQSAGTTRINRHYIVHELQHSVLHVDKGIFFTIKELIMRPGEMLSGYLSGKRVSHFKPVAFLVILATLYGFICHFFKVYPEGSFSFTESGNSAVDEQSLFIYEWVYGHYSFVMLAFTPFYALGAYLLFRKYGYNYMEFFVISCYIAGMQILMLIATYPIYYFTLSSWVVIFIFVLNYLYHIWVFIHLFRHSSPFTIIIKTIISMVISFCFITIAIFILALVYVILLHGHI